MAKKMTVAELTKTLEDATDKKEILESKLQKTNDTNDKKLYEAEIIKLDRMIEELNRDIQELSAQEENANVEKKWNQQKSAVKTVIEKNYMGYFPTEGKFIYCRDYGKDVSNVQFKVFPETRIVRVLSKLGGFNVEQRDYHKVIDYFQDCGKVFLETTSSFNRNKWDESDIYNKMTVIRDHWVQPDYANAEFYDRRFDLLMTCVGGGKEENIRHLEQWVAFKYLNPNKNAMIPNLDIGGNPGGNGKGRLTEILKTIFTSACVVQAHKEELDKFNANWEMAVVLYYDEPEEKELAASKLKQATGAEDMRVEKKGIDATMADRNYNFIFLSNNEKGVVKLSGGPDGGEDRRYSVLTTDIILKKVCIDGGMSVQETDAFLQNIAQQLIKDRAEVAKWLAHIIIKHNAQSMDSLPPLHGTDYHERFDDQKDAITIAFDTIMPVWQDQKILPLTVLTDFVKVHTENHGWTEKGIVGKWEIYLKRNCSEEHTSKKKQRCQITWRDDDITISQGKAYSLDNFQNTTFDLSKMYAKKPMGIGAPLNKNDIII